MTDSATYRIYFAFVVVADTFFPNRIKQDWIDKPSLINTVLIAFHRYVRIDALDMAVTRNIALAYA